MLMNNICMDITLTTDLKLSFPLQSDGMNIPLPEFIFNEKIHSAKLQNKELTKQILSISLVSSTI